MCCAHPSSILAVSCSKTINIDVESRWNSTARMLQDALECRPTLCEFVKREGMVGFAISEMEWAEIASTCHLLTKFEAITEELSKGSTLITASLPISYELDDIMDNAQMKLGDFANLSDELSQAVAAAEKKFAKYYKIMNQVDIYYICSFLAYTTIFLKLMLKALLIQCALKSKQTTREWEPPYLLLRL